MTITAKVGSGAEREFFSFAQRDYNITVQNTVSGAICCEANRFRLQNDTMMLLLSCITTFLLDWKHSYLPHLLFLKKPQCIVYI